MTDKTIEDKTDEAQIPFSPHPAWTHRGWMIRTHRTYHNRSNSGHGSQHYARKLRNGSADCSQASRRTTFTL